MLLGLLVLLEIWYFLRFKYHLEKMALIVLISDLCLFVVRIFIPEGEENSNKDLDFIFIIIPLGNTVMWLVLGYIVYQMSTIRNKIESETLESYQERHKKLKTIAIIHGIIFTLVFLPTNIVAYLYAKQMEYAVLSLLIGLRCIILFVSGLYFFPAFLGHMIYFVKFKKNLQGDQNLSGWQVAVLVWVFFLWFLKLIQALSMIFVVPIYQL